MPVSRLKKIDLIGCSLLLLATVWFAHPLFLVHTAGHALPGMTWHNLLFDSHEKLHYIIRLSEFDDALRHGQWFPRWCNNLCGAYGYPFFNFYAPLAYYLAVPFFWITGDLFAAWKLQFILVSFAGAFGAWYYARIFLCHAAAWLTALLFVLAPYHIANIYVRGNVAEFTAMSLLPWVFWAFHRVAIQPVSMFKVVVSSLTLAALILSHNVTALFGCGLLALYVSSLAVNRRSWKVLFAPAISVITALLLTAFFWAPALYEMRYCQKGEMQETFVQTATHVIYWPQYFRDNWGFGLSLPGADDDLPFGIGLVHLVLIGVAAGYAVRQRTLRARLLPFLAALFFLLAIMSNWCAWLWQLPLIRTVQFPWRILSLVTLVSAVCAAFVVELFPARIQPYVLAVAAAVLVAWSAPRLSVSGYFPMPSATYTPANTRLHDTMTNVGEFLPIWAEPDKLPKPSDKQVVSADGRRLGLLAGEDSTQTSFVADIDQDTSAVAHVIYFPGWQAYRNGKALLTKPGKNGLVEFPLLAGRAQYTLKFGSSPFRFWCNISSLSAAVALLIIISVIRIRRVPVFV